MNRTIVHVDMDAFYASVEQRDHPGYRGKPVIVGADPKQGSGRGVVAACSYEARRFGIHSAMPISKAYRLCAGGVFLRPDFPKYSRISREIRSILRSFTELVEPLSIDEAFLDLSQNVGEGRSSLELAEAIKREIQVGQELHCSIGIAPNKFVAKIASDLEKPKGLVRVPPEQVQSFLDPLPIARLWGVGPKTEARLVQMGVRTILQLRQLERERLANRFGKFGEHLWALSRGLDNRPVVARRTVKSIGHETTFPEDSQSPEQIRKALLHLSNRVSGRLGEKGLGGKTVTLKLRYSDFTTLTRQSTFRAALEQGADIYRVVRLLLEKYLDPRQKIRLVGVSVSSLESMGDRTGKQMELFGSGPGP